MAIRLVARLALVTLLASASATCGAETTSLALAETPDQADAFVDGLGVNGHFTDFYNPNPYDRNFEKLNRILVTAGLRHLRNAVNINAGSAGLAEMRTLASEGITYSAMVTPEIMSLAEIEKSPTLAAGPTAIQFAEGPNEPDLSGGDWAVRMHRSLIEVSAVMRESPNWKGIPLIAAPLAFLKNAAAIGNQSAFFSAGNIHYGPVGTNPGMAPLSDQLKLATAYSGDRPIWVTETGYGNDGGACAATSTVAYTPDDVIARYDPRLYAEWWRLGVRHVFFYQLSDMTGDGQFGCSGLVDDNGVVKPQLTALAGMIRLLADPGPRFTPSIYRWTLSGETRDVHHVTLQKRDGSIWLLLWIERSGWDLRTASRIAVGPQTVTIAPAHAPNNATAYTYDARTWLLHSTPLRLARDGTITVNATDAITFVRLSSSSPSPAVPSGIPSRGT